MERSDRNATAYSYIYAADDMWDDYEIGQYYPNVITLICQSAERVHDSDIYQGRNEDPCGNPNPER